MPERRGTRDIARVALVGVVVILVSAGLGAALAALRSSPEPSGLADVGLRNPEGFRGNPLPKGIVREPAPDFELADARGGTIGTLDMAGRPYLVTFLYSDCPDVCALIAEEIRQAFKLLRGRAEEVAALAVSVDPRGDTRENVLRFLRRHRLPPNFHYLIGTRDQLAPVWRAYYAAPQLPGRAASAHSASVWVIDARGRIRTKFSGGAPIPPADIAHDLRQLLREEAGSRS
ncbi:MAG: SCO family protein [Thermoleophilaceae bacterium]